MSLKPNCAHEICAVCVFEIFATGGLKDTCGLCRRDLPRFPEDYKANYNKPYDLKAEECAAAAIIAAQENNIKIIRFLANQGVNLGQEIFNGAVNIFLTLYVTGQNNQKSENV